MTSTWGCSVKKGSPEVVDPVAFFSRINLCLGTHLQNAPRQARRPRSTVEFPCAERLSFPFRMDMKLRQETLS